MQENQVYLDILTSALTDSATRLRFRFHLVVVDSTSTMKLSIRSGNSRGLDPKQEQLVQKCVEDLHVNSSGRVSFLTGRLELSGTEFARLTFEVVWNSINSIMTRSSNEYQPNNDLIDS